MKTQPIEKQLCRQPQGLVHHFLGVYVVHITISHCHLNLSCVTLHAQQLYLEIPLDTVLSCEKIYSV